jgi:hypothetical protein
MGGEDDGIVRWCPPNRTVGSLGSDVRFDFFQQYQRGRRGTRAVVFKKLMIITGILIHSEIGLYHMSLDRFIEVSEDLRCEFADKLSKYHLIILILISAYN